VLAGTGGPGGQDFGGLAKDGPIDTMAPGPGLAAVAAGACDPAVLAALSDNQVLGLAAAGRRLAGRAAWIQQAAVAEFAARRLEHDPKKATPLGFTPFAPDELVPELVITTTSAEEAMARARDVARRLRACFALLRDGVVSEYQIKIITDATVGLSDEGAAEADKLLAAAAPGLTPRAAARHVHPHRDDDRPRRRSAPQGARRKGCPHRAVPGVFRQRGAVRPGAAAGGGARQLPAHRRLRPGAAQGRDPRHPPAATGGRLH
jgi:hypothetical protein